MKKIFLTGLLGVVLLILTSYYLVSTKRISSSVLTTNISNNSIWLQDLIKQQESNPVTNPPASLSKCTYRNQSVYYLPPRCCDIPSIVYNDKGGIICSPDGGLTGKGDGKCTDFFNTKKDCVVVWKDARSQ